jgi:hypothetical protein
MTELTKDDVKAMGKAVGLHIQGADLPEVTGVLNAVIEAVAEIHVPGLELVEPLPIILPQRERS